jgi:hypothetical protein
MYRAPTRVKANWQRAGLKPGLYKAVTQVPLSAT